MNKRYVAKQADHCPLPIKTDPLPLGPDIISGHKISQDGAAAINMSDLSFKINLLSPWLSHVRPSHSLWSMPPLILVL
jgi:hypothetical protein